MLEQNLWILFVSWRLRGGVPYPSLQIPEDTAL
jgi:hypothetical protein